MRSWCICRHLLDSRNDLLQRFRCCLRCLVAILDLLQRSLDQASGIYCRLCTLFGQFTDLFCHHCKSSTGISCTLSLFTGLYGGFAMQISDWIARNAPILGTINPAQQVTNLFYDILYYDSYRPFITTCIILLAMSAVFLLAGIAMLRRQRYEHL